MGQKIRVGLLFGGKSAEHEVSLQSAKNVFEAIDQDKYEVTLIGIDKAGRWLKQEAAAFLLEADDPKRIRLRDSTSPVHLDPAGGGSPLVVAEAKPAGAGPIDVVFPVLHGPFGEDGTVQGLLKMADVPFVGASVLGSAVGMDKDVMKRLLKEAGLPTPRFLVFYRRQRDSIRFEEVVAALGLPFFVKPANLGSSVGISKVHNEQEFFPALDEALRFDHKALIEEAIVGREIECAVLGNDDPQASTLGEVVPRREFYSYEAKYIDENGALLKIPAELDPAMARRVQDLAVQTFRVLCCEGLARVDFFLRPSGEVLVNEINTLPGFTRISMYPRLWEASGLPYPALIDRLIALAIERAERDRALKTRL